MPIRILIADDHGVVAEGLKQLVEAESDMQVVALVGDGREAVQQARDTQPDVVLMDLSMPELNGADATRAILERDPRCRVIVLSMYAEREYVRRALKAGASGYLTKESASRQLVEAIRKVVAGGAFISAEVAQQLALGAMPDVKGPPHTALSDREFQIFRMIADGLAVSDIAGRLNLSVKTVSTHKSNILQKMGMTTQAELIRYAITHRLVDEPGEPG